MKKTAGIICHVIVSLIICLITFMYIKPSAMAASGNWNTSGNYDTTIASASAANRTITTAAQLAGLAVAVNVNGTSYSGYTVTLGADIDLSDHYWIPIGTTDSKYFQGTFNGAGHTISGLTISSTTYQYVGLFGYIKSSGAQMKNLTLSSGYISASYSGTLYCGSLVGCENGMNIYNCGSSVPVYVSTSGEANVGGLIGYAGLSGTTACYIENCSYTSPSSVYAYITSTSYVERIGGLVGYSYGMSGYYVNISNCRTAAQVISGGGSFQNAGGVCGEARYTDHTSCSATGSVTASKGNDKRIGGFIGVADDSSGEYSCYATGSVSSTGTATNNNVGGFIGYQPSGVTSNCYSTGTVTGSGGSYLYRAGFVGYNKGTVNNCYYRYNAYSDSYSGYGANNNGTLNNLLGLTTAQLQNVGVISNTYLTGSSSYIGDSIIDALNYAASGRARTRPWSAGGAQNSGFPVFSTLWSDLGNYDAAIASAPASNLTITTPAQLAGLAVAVNNGTSYAGFTVTLGANINMSAYIWEPIGDSTNYFQGSFNGAGYTISGLNITTISERYAGLFGYVKSSGATISNLNISGSLSASCGYDELDCGGLAGYVCGTSISKCSSSVTITVYATYEADVGGLVGYINVNGAGNTINNCSFTGSVDATTSATSYSLRAGGLVALSYGTSSYYIIVSNCSSTGSIYSNGGSYENTGGFIGEDYYTSCYNCYATGTVSAGPGNDKRTGGFIGVTNSSSGEYNCFATGSVSSWGTSTYNCVGGFIGYINSGVTSNCYSTGAVTGSGGSSGLYRGGFVGNNRGTVTNCYYLYNAYSSSYTGYGTNSGTLTSLVGLTTAQLQNTSAITTDYKTGTTSYSGYYITYALNAAAGSISNAKTTWSVINGTNNTYPIFLYLWSDSGNYDTTIANATASNLTITTAAQLAGLAVAVNSGTSYSNYTVTLGADIDLSAYYWTPIGYSNYKFFGTFEGAGHTISGMKVSTSNLTYYGLFGYAYGGYVKNLNVTGSINTINRVGSGGIYAGGIIGDCELASISGCSSSVSIYMNVPNGCIGGLVGVSSTMSGTDSISNCSATGDVNAVGENMNSVLAAGGFVGNISESTGESNGYYYKVKNCYSTGNVTTSGTSGTVYGGGFAGILNYVDMSNCYSTGSITDSCSASIRVAGGFVGSGWGKFYNCYSVGSVALSGSVITVYAGGFAAYVYDSSNYDCVFNNCYSSGGVTTTATSGKYGGFFGRSTGSGISVYNCYYLYNAYSGSTIGYGSSTAIIYGLTGLTAAQLKNTSVITDTYFTGTIAYNNAGRNLVMALDTAASAITDAKAWGVVSGTNSGYPIHGDFLTITYMSPDTTTIYAVDTAVSGSTVTEPPTPIQAGYAFGGWYKDTGLETAWDFSTDTVTAAVTLYSKWTVIPVALTANTLDSGVYNSSYSATIDAATGGSGTFTYSVTSGALPSGLDFTPSTRTISGTPSVAGTFNFTITAADSANGLSASADYTLEIEGLGTVSAPTASIASGSIEAGESIVLTCSISGAEIYYTTDGSTPTSASTKYTEAIAITANVTIKAIALVAGYEDSEVAALEYTVNGYTVSYDGNGSDSGTVPDSATYVKGAEVTVSGNTGSLVRAGYVFGGWNTLANGQGTSYSADDKFVMQTSDVKLYAVWNAEISGFAEVPSVSAGTTLLALYADAAAVEAALPATVTANYAGGTVSVPVASWIDTDTYSATTVGIYTFTAVLGTLPTGYLNSGSFTATVEVIITVPYINLTSFAAIENVSAGNVGSATYADAAAVMAALPMTATANTDSGTVSIPVASWTDTDTYDPNTVGSYTFTAVLGTLPEGYSNTENVTATVEVVIIENVELTGFSAIANIDAGKAGAATYADVAAVQTYLMTTYSAVEATYSGGTVSVPVSSWTDTDTYDASKAGSYTFTAVLGTIPTGYANTENYTATVEVIVGAGACLFEINAASDYATSHPNLRIVDYTKGSTTYHLIRGLNPNLETVSKVMSYFTVTNGTVKLYKYSSGSFVEVQSTDTITVVGTGFKVMLYDNTNTSVNTYYFLIKGDTNSDGKINNSDRTIAKNHISSKTLITNDIIWIAADINSDGKINNSDVTLIKNHISSKARITQ